MKKLAFIIIILALGIFSLRQAKPVNAQCGIYTQCSASQQCITGTIPTGGTFQTCVDDYNAACTGGAAPQRFMAVVGDYNGGMKGTGCYDQWNGLKAPSVYTDHRGFANGKIGAGDTFGLVIAFQNAGYQNWSSNGVNDPNGVKLGNPADRDDWGWGIRVPVGGTVQTVQPGYLGCPNQNCVFNAYYGTIDNITSTAPQIATAPSTPGIYPFKWQMLKESYKWFGPTINFDVLVFPKPTISPIPTSMTNQPGITVTVQAPPACSVNINLNPGAGLTNCTTSGMSCSTNPNSPNYQTTNNCSIVWTCNASGNATSNATATFTADNNPSCAATANYTVNSKPTLGAQTRSPGPDAAGSGVGISGLRADDPNLTANTGTGSNIYNSIKITQPVNLANANNVKLVGVAFTSKGSPPTNSSLYEMTRSAYSDTGFVLTYAAQPASTPYKTQNWWDAMQDFTPKRYYLYRQGSWTDVTVDITTAQGYQTLDNSLKVKLDPDNQLLVKPIFDVTPLQPLGSHTWGTYGYLMDSNNTQTLTP